MSSNDWDQHKAIITHLYLLENRSLYEVIEYMKHKHNFDKNKAQYEYQFRKWGTKKNSKKEEWKSISRQLEKREGKKTEVIKFGIPLSPSKVRKGIQRYKSIPTAKEFGKRLPSPESPGTRIVTARSPIIFENIRWPDLPWFRFKDRVFQSSQNLSALLRAFLTLPGLRQPCFEDQEEGALQSLYGVLRNPTEFRKAIFHLANTIPDNRLDEQQENAALEGQGSSSKMAKEILKLIFFRLSNKMVPGDYRESRVHDQFVLQLVEAISYTRPEMLSDVLSSRCLTENSIKEAIYGSAVREKNYNIVSRLLESGLDPDLPIGCTESPVREFKSGLFRLRWQSTRHGWNGMKEAAFTADVRLGKILLRHKASLRCHPESLLSLAALQGARFEGSNPGIEFIQLLIEHGMLDDSSVLCCPHQVSKLMSPIAVSVAGSNDCVAEFLIQIDESLNLSQRSSDVSCTKSCMEWDSSVFKDLRISHSPLHIAIASGNGEMIERLLQLVISSPTEARIRTIQEALLTSCLAGDADTALKILALHPNLPQEWTLGITPLAMTAWNTRDLTVAETLLRLGAHIGPTRNDQVCEVPAPIHVAAYHGNTSLMQKLIDRGANCDVCYKPSRDRTYFWLLPTKYSSPLQFALQGRNDENVDTAKLLEPHSSLIGGELAAAVCLGDAALISDILSKEIDVLWGDKLDEEVLENAAKMGNMAIISSYFFSGGPYTSKALYLAIEAAITSKNHNIVHLLASHRPIAEIDKYEASALVLSIERCEWDLVFILLADPFLPSPAEAESWILDESSDSTDKRTPLMAAFLSTNSLIVESIISRGYVPKCSDIWRLMEVECEPIRHDFWAKFSLKNMDLPCRRAIFLHAVKSGNTDKVREYIGLIDCLIDFPYEPYMSGTYSGDDIVGFPLSIAAYRGHIEVVRLLLDAGADVNFTVELDPGIDAPTALVEAACEGHLHIVKLLLDRGASVDPEEQLEEGATALQYAAIHGHFKMAQLLISRGADPNAIPAKRNGQFALESAAAAGRLDMVMFLLNNGARISGNMRLIYVRSVGYARKWGHYALADFLARYGSWGEKDQILYNDPRTFHDNVYLFENDIVTRRVDVPPSANSGSMELPSASYDPDCVFRGDWSRLDHSEYDSDTADEEVMRSDLESSRSSTAQMVDDIEDIVEEQHDIEFNTADGITTDDRATCRIEIQQHRRIEEEGMSEFRINDCMPGANLMEEQATSPNGMEIEWEGPFFGFSEPVTDDCAADQMDIWEGGSMMREVMPSLEANIYAPEAGPANQQMMELNEMEMGWEGPFTDFDGFEDFGDMMTMFPLYP
ncbi:ankyrin repeat-containing domain protein [Nemania abortiva]|nr:ankyrin repeat-containing domain protein [Nemania abortiva]